MANSKKSLESNTRNISGKERPNVYHDPERLLKTYRDVRWNLKLSMESHRSDFEDEYGMCITEYLDSLHAAGAEFKGTRLEHHANTMKRTAEMLKLIDASAYLIREKNSEGEIYFWILYYTYLSPQKLNSIDEIIERIQMHVHYLTKHTYYRYHRKTIKTFASVLWGFTTKDEGVILDNFIS